MTALQHPVSRRSPQRLSGFIGQMFPPHLYAVYGALWALSLEGSAVLLAGRGRDWSPSWRTGVRAGTVVLILLFLRMADEQKDFEYDQIHHRDRPLVTGAITRAELRAGMALIAAVIAGANVAVSRLSAPLALTAPGYALVLTVIERRSARVRNGQLLNLAVTYPVQAIAGLYVYLSLADCGAISADWRVLPLLLIFACAFLQFEFARKTAWHADPGERSYSGTALGAAGSGLAVLAFAAGAAVIALTLLRPWRLAGAAVIAGWLPFVALLFPVLGSWQFFARRRPAWPVPLAMAFIVTFFLSLIVQALAIRKGAQP